MSVAHVKAKPFGPATPGLDRCALLMLRDTGGDGETPVRIPDAGRR
jgi:hypothetical protein